MSLFLYGEILILVIAIFILGILVFKYKDYKEEDIADSIEFVSAGNGKNLEEHAESISHENSKIKQNVSRKNLIKSLDSSFNTIVSTYNFMEKESRENKNIISSAEWLLDNLYLIEKEYKGIKEAMPRSYYKELPLMEKGIMKGYPRVYHLAIQIVSHTEGQIDETTIKRFIKSYEKHTVLSMAELWAMPIMIRIALIQNISRICDKISFIQGERDKAEFFGDMFINAFNEERLNEEISKLYKLQVDFNPFFAERLLKLLRDNSVDNGEIYNWIEEKLEESETTFEHIVSNAHKKESYYEMSIGNSINSIRKMESLSWEDNFEELCKVNEILDKDPLGVYSTMDFKSRDYYRHEIQKISKSTGKSELTVAKKALECAKNPNGKEEYLKHIGYYIFDEGKKELIDKLGNEAKSNSKIGFKPLEHRVRAYLCTLTVLTIAIIGVFLKVSYDSDFNFKLWKYILAFLVLIIPCSEIVISIFNWSATKLAPIRFIPKLELSEGITEENSTIVIVPTLINNVKRARELVSELEVYYLSNKEKNLYFAILGDFKDSKTEIEEEDKNIVEATLSEIKNLNKKYGFKNGEERFFFFCRYRQFNSSEGYYLGWERKRGKIVEFNLLLRGEENTSYNVISSDIKNLKKAKYIITLDADTILPKDSARKLIGAMEHPLNKAYLTEDGKTVLRGYGLMQPRVSVSIESSNKTLFSKILSGETGIDTYSTAVSDVYQDLFGEGIFTGKGIYNIDVFNSTLKDEIPENLVLSHDLLEGSYMRTALVSDIELIDSYPAYYNSSSKRLGRWVRGDWQLLSWITNKRINLLSRWKIVDNLRRSMLAPFLILIIILGLLNILPDGIDKWFMVTFLTLTIPIIFDVTESIVSPMKGLSLSGRVKNHKMATNQFFLIFAFLPHKAIVMVESILRTIYRLFISKKNLLQWQTAADVEKTVGRELSDFIKFMWGGSLISALILFLSFNKSSYIGIIMFIPCAIWFLSPLIAYYVSLPCYDKTTFIKKDEALILRRLARETWAYFEDFVNEENNWLGPDNYQEDPPNGLATRTSPTNIGMALSSNIVALDMGYIGLLEALERLDNIVLSMNTLESYKGHFYNWYNTVTKEPLYPRFISTVDSGNLVGYLWLCGKTLNEKLNSPYFNKCIKKGLNDTLNLSKKEITEILGKENKIQNINLNEETELDIIAFRKTLMYILENLNKAFENAGSKSLYWSNKVKKDIQAYIREIDEVFPWVKIIEEEEIGEPIKLRLISVSSKINLKDIQEELYSIEEDLLEINPKLNIIDAVKSSRIYIASIIDRIKTVREELDKIAYNTDFKFLYSKKRKLFSIGFDMENKTLNNSYYDLLASESRQASFVAIAKGDVPKEHWFKLGRSMTLIGRNKGLVSWSGTMFEYFMPLLIMKTYPDTLLNNTYNSVLYGQRKYAKHRGVPFGISESAFYNFDINKNYQYKAFGVPGIGLKRGLINELVISPYSTVLALQKDLKNSLINIKGLIKEDLEGIYGFYEAIDYTKYNSNKNNKNQIVKCFMIHHQGMSLMAIDNVLNDNILQERFHSIPIIKSIEILLQEKVPNKIVYDREYKFDLKETKFKKQRIIERKYTKGNTIIPEVQLLSNGNLSLMISNSGSGYTKFKDTFLYRWRADVTEDNTGLYVYIKDSKTKEYWSATYSPTMEEGQDYEVSFSIDKAEFKKNYKNILSKTEVIVSSEDDVEIRKITLENLGEEEREIELISYGEVVLADYDGDLVHQAFSNLFITTEFVNNPLALICKRRPRAKGKTTPYLVHTLATNAKIIEDIEYETARVDFIGRGGNKKEPQALNKENLENSKGVVLDPIISLKAKVSIPKGEKIELAFITAYSDNRDEVLYLARKYGDMTVVNRQYNLTLNAAQTEMRYLGIKSPQANLYQDMASRILYLSPLMKKREEYIKNIIKNQSSLWSYGISGDVPIVLLLIKEEKNIDKLIQIISAHEYWNLKGLKVDLVIINEEENSYHNQVKRTIMDIIYSGYGRDKLNKSGGIFVLNKENMNLEDLELFKALARIVIDGEGDLIKNQIHINKYGELSENNRHKHKEHSGEKLNPPTMDFYNGYGGFSKDGSEYIIHLKEEQNTPAPWINVISNPKFGFHISESGSAYTWSENSRENKITNWNNDWVSDPPSEVLYLKDEESGDFWSITPKPIRGEGDYLITHGFGYSKFSHTAFNIEGEEKMFLPMDESLKFIKVRLKNKEKKKRTLSLTYYAHLVMGVVPAHTSDKIATFYHSEGFLYAKNPYSMHFNESYAFLKTIGVDNLSYTGCRTEFIGRMRDTENPAGLYKKELSNTVGAGMDPCFAMKGEITLEPGEERELVVLFGEEKSLERVEALVNKYSSMESIDKEFEKTLKYWKETLGAIKVNTPEKSMDILVNGWLMYQTIACRLWARTAFYQSGGAFGFRDQLQDVMPIAYLNPKITRDQILHSASRQFIEGDVQHWWHPGVDSGIRTRFSDDLLWLPYVTLDYIKNTGDYSILDEEATYLYDEPLRDGEDERYTISKVADKKESIYDHCIRAIEKGLNFGAHNIPLMGSGDWNDGMSTVGNKGKGESVWLGWFLYSILKDFIKICRYKNDIERAEKYEESKEFIKENINKNAWDGEWYRRAYFDDGTPLGSKENKECKIDSLSQSWSVISEGGEKEKVEKAIESLEKYLIKEEEGLILLLTPPFYSSDLEPGYIKGYVRGVRENGGQYTHASTWVILAMCKLKKQENALKLFNMINPIKHTDSKEKCEIYKTEPFVMTADVYGVEPHIGRGGWSWYTGTSSWMYRVAIEGILGLKLLEKKGFTIDPCIPKQWNEYEILYKKDKTLYKIKVLKGEEKGILMDGVPLKENIIPYSNDSKEHIIEVTI